MDLANRPLASPRGTEVIPNKSCLPTDSFKDDIQAIGKAVERLREGFAGVSGGLPKDMPEAGHDSSPWLAALSSSTLASGNGFLPDQIKPEQLGVLGGGETSSIVDAGESSAKEGDKGFVEDSGLHVQTSPSQGRLSVQELHATDEELNFSWDERLDRKNDGAVPGSYESLEIIRQDARRAREHDSPSRWEVRSSHASSVVVTEEHREGTKNAQPGKRSKVFRAQGRDTAVSTSLQPSSPVSLSDLDRGTFATTGLETSSEVGDSSLAGTRKMGRAKRSVARLRRQSREGENDAGAIGNVAEPNSLFELREALKVREMEILRLKSDVAAVATSAGSFKNLTRASGSSGKAESSGGFGGSAVGDDSDSYISHILEGSPEACSGTGCSSHGSNSSLETGRERTTRSAVAGADEMLRSSREEVGPRRRSSDKLVATAKAQRLPASQDRKASERLRGERDSNSRRSLQSSQEAIAEPDGASARGGSPLLANAHEGLRKMRLVLEQRARETSRAKDDTGKMAARVQDLSTRLRRFERKCSDQTAELCEARAEAKTARSEVSRLSRAKEASDTKNSDERTALALALRERDSELARLRERFETATGELSAEKEGVASLRARLEASDGELRHARERARAAEDDASARASRAACSKSAAQEQRVAELERALEERSTDLERAKADARAAAAELRVAEEKTRRQLREAATARDQLRVEKEGSVGGYLELETAIRERTQTVEKLALAETESKRLQVELAAALEKTNESQKLRQERKQAIDDLEAAESELSSLRGALARAREGEEAERLRSQRESQRVTTLKKELEASESRQKNQEEEIALVRKQVAELDAKVDGDMDRRQAETGTFVDGRAAVVEKEAARLRTICHRMEADVRATRERERRAVEDSAGLRAELLVIRDGRERAEAALAKALDFARAAEAAAESRARELAAAVDSAMKAADSARQDKEALKRRMAAAQTQAAEARAANSRLLAERDRAEAVELGDAAKAVAEAVEVAAAEASEAATETAVASALRMRTELEGRLARAVAEANQLRAEAKLLKAKLKMCERKHGAPILFVADVGTRSRTNRRDAGTWILLREACSVMDNVAMALSAASEKVGFGDDGARKPDNSRRVLHARRGRPRNRKRGAAEPGAVGTLTPGYVRRRAFSVDSSSEVVGNRIDTDDDAVSEVRFDDVNKRYVSTLEVRETLERLRFEAATLVAVRRDEQKAAAERVSRLQAELRILEGRKAETAARLEESRELTREQTSFVEGVWQERRRLEAELAAGREEAERLRASEDAARGAVTILEGRVEDLSTALRQEQVRARREAEAGTRSAMGALRTQLDDLRREVERARLEQEARGTGPRAFAAGRGVTGSTVVGSEAVLKESDKGAAQGTRLAAGGVPASAVLEAEFQRLRAKYDKAKGRIAALEELVAVSRRVSAQARKEFQGALDALKLSQEMLLKIHGQHQGDESNAVDSPPTLSNARTASSPPTSASMQEGQAASAGCPSTDAHVRELAVQASRLRGMSGNVKQLLQLAAGEVQGVLQDTRESYGLAMTEIESFPSGAPASRKKVAMTGTQTDNKSLLLVVEEKLAGAEADVQALEADKARLDVELGRALEELAGVQEQLREKTSQARGLKARVARSEADRQEARKIEKSLKGRLAETETAAERARHDIEVAQKELHDTKGRLDTAIGVQDELRERCEELALASGAFAAEVAKQKQERSKSQERSRRTVEASAVELRERCAEFSRASEASAAECTRLKKELEKAQSEAQEVEDDVAQVLDALASSEKERRRLEQELDLQCRKTVAVEGTAEDVRKNVDRERAALCEKAGKLEDVVQASASRLEESLKMETKQRKHLEQERRRLASRVTDLEAALISASSEARKAVKLAAERTAAYELSSMALKDEIVKLKKNMREESELAAKERKQWAEDKIAMQERATTDKNVALAEAERAFRENVEERERLANVREQNLPDSSTGASKEMTDVTEALQEDRRRAAEAIARETISREKAVRDVTMLKHRVAELETALEKATSAARTAGDAARKVVDPISQMQAEMRSAISSLLEEKEDEEGGEEPRNVGSVLRRPVSSDGESQSGSVMPSYVNAGSAVSNKGVKAIAVDPRRFHSEDFPPFDEDSCWKARNTYVDDNEAFHGLRGAHAFAADAPWGRRSLRKSARGCNRRFTSMCDKNRPDSTATVGGRASLPTESIAWATDPPLGAAASSTIRPSPRAESIAGIPETAPGAGASVSSTQRAETSGLRNRWVSPDGGTVTRSVSRPGQITGLATSNPTLHTETVSRPRRIDGVATSDPSAKTEASWKQGGDNIDAIAGPMLEQNTLASNKGTVSVGGEGANKKSPSQSLTEASQICDDGDDDSSYSAVQSICSTTDASGLSSSLASAPLDTNRNGYPKRSGSVVVRDWKAGQREAFSELDRKAFSSSGGGRS